MRRPVVGLVVVLMASAVSIGAAVFWRAIASDAPQEDARAPASVVGKSPGEAKAELESQGLQVRIVGSDGEAYDPAGRDDGVVTAEVVTAGPPGDTATVTIAVSCPPACPSEPSDGAAPGGTCERPGDLAGQSLSPATVARGGEVAVTGPAPATATKIYVAIDRTQAASLPPFAVPAGSGESLSAPACIFEVRFRVPNHLEPGQYYVYVLIGQAKSMAPPIPLEVT